MPLVLYFLLKESAIKASLHAYFLRQLLTNDGDVESSCSVFGNNKI